VPSVCRCPATPRRRSAVDAWRCRVGHRPWLGRIVALLGLWGPGKLERELDPLFEGSFVLGLALTLEGSQDIAPRPRWWRLETRCLGLLRHQRRRSVVAGSLRRLPPVSRGCARRTARAVVNTDNARPEPWQLSGHIPPGCEQPRWRCGCRTYVPSHVATFNWQLCKSRDVRCQAAQAHASSSYRREGGRVAPLGWWLLPTAQLAYGVTYGVVPVRWTPFATAPALKPFRSTTRGWSWRPPSCGWPSMARKAASGVPPSVVR
jgi:hypothetical protein